MFQVRPDGVERPPCEKWGGEYLEAVLGWPDREKAWLSGVGRKPGRWTTDHFGWDWPSHRGHVKVYLNGCAVHKDSITNTHG